MFDVQKVKPFTNNERISVPNTHESKAKKVFRQVAQLAKLKMEEVYTRRFDEDLDMSEIVMFMDDGLALFFRREDVEKNEPFFGQGMTEPSVEYNQIADREESHVGVTVYWY